MPTLAADEDEATMNEKGGLTMTYIFHAYI
jgi:hypothetical protein